jgi:hypothetical protein
MGSLHDRKEAVMLINDRLKLAAMDPNNVAIDDLKSMARELLARRGKLSEGREMEKCFICGKDWANTKNTVMDWHHGGCVEVYIKKLRADIEAAAATTAAASDDAAYAAASAAAAAAYAASAAAAAAADDAAYAAASAAAYAAAASAASAAAAASAYADDAAYAAAYAAAARMKERKWQAEKIRELVENPFKEVSDAM